MSTENTQSPEQSATATTVESNTQTESVDFQSDEFFSSLLGEINPTKAEAQPPIEETAQETVAVQDPVVAEETAEERKEALSPLLAARAQKERELRQKLEQSKTEREAEITAAKQAVVDELKKDPSGFAKKYGIDNAGDLALHFYALELGDDAPDDLKAQLGRTEMDRFREETEKRFAQLEYEKAEAEIKAKLRTVAEQYQGFIAAVPADSMPYFAAEAAHDADGAYAAMAEVADHINATSGRYPTALEVAQLIESQISETAARYAAIKRNPDAVTEHQTDQVAKAKAKSTISPTLSNDQSGSSAKRAPQGEDELFESALELFEQMTTG